MKKRGSAKIPKTIDQYLADVPPDKRDALEKLRKAINAAVPRAEECIAYQIPSFRLDGRYLVAFGAAAVETHKKDLKRYGLSKGTIRFQADDPLPASLVRKLVKARIVSAG